MLLTPPCLYPFVSSWQLLFIYLAVVGLHCWMWALPSWGKQGLLFVVMHGLLTAVASLVAEYTGSRLLGFSSCSIWTQWLWCMGLATPWHVGSSQTRDQTSVPCMARQILNHWTREAWFFLITFLSWARSQALHMNWLSHINLTTMLWHTYRYPHCTDNTKFRGIK